MNCPNCGVCLSLSVSAPSRNEGGEGGGVSGVRNPDSLSLNPPIVPQKPRRRRFNPPRPYETRPDFVAFWEAAGTGDKQKAFDLWVLFENELPRLEAHLAIWKDYVASLSAGYNPCNLTTWLNGRRWQRNWKRQDVKPKFTPKAYVPDYT